MRVLIIFLMSVLMLGACSSTNKTASKKVNVTDVVLTSGSTDKSAQQLQWELDYPQILKYLEVNNIDAQWLNSGLYYVIVDEGEGARATENSEVKVSYSISQLDGTLMWSTYKENTPESYAMNNVIRGWREGIPLIKEGGRIQLIVPSGLAYGEEGLVDNVPPNTNLVFDLELLEVN